MSKDKQQQPEMPPTPKDLRDQVYQNADRLKQIYQSVEKMRKYFLATMIINILVFVLPLIAAAFIIPMFLDSYLGQLQGLGL